MRITLIRFWFLFFAGFSLGLLVCWNCTTFAAEVWLFALQLKRPLKPLGVWCRSAALYCLWRFGFFFVSLRQIIHTMETPKIATFKGLRPVTILPDEALVAGFLSASTGNNDLVQLLSFAAGSAKVAGAILRQCLTAGAKLVAVYHALKETPPTGAKLVGSIPDGGLYVVYNGCLIWATKI